MNLLEKQYGGLNCHIVDSLAEGASPELVVVFCHGYGAPATDLVGLAPELFQLQPSLEKKTRFVFPAAPLSLAGLGLPDGRAWWPIDMQQLTAAIERGELRDQRKYFPPELADIQERMLALIDQVGEEDQVSPEKFVLGGFSQGSMVATETALHMSTPPAALCILSGTLLCEQRWKEAAGRLHESGSRDSRPLRVLQSHGRQDPVLPFQGAVWLRDMLTAAGAEVRFIAFDGYHSIPYEVIQELGRQLEQLLEDA